MKALLVLCLLVGGVAHSQTLLYDNGPDDGSGPSYWVSYGWSVSDSFPVTESQTIDEVQVSLWTSTSPQNPPEHAEWIITDSKDEPRCFGSSLLNNRSNWQAGAYTIWTSVLQNMDCKLDEPDTYFITIYHVTSKYPFWVRWGTSADGTSIAFKGPVQSIEYALQIPSEAFQVWGH